MTAWAFTLAYNEAPLIAYWVRAHAWCSRIVVYVDTDSDDDTLWIARKAGAEVRTYTGTGHLDDFAFVAFAEHAYKEARGHADWVIWTDADEIVYHPRLPQRLAELKAAGVNLPRTVGYAMLGDQPPIGSGQIYDEIRYGIPAAEYSKVAVFNPMLDLKWTAGKHDVSVRPGKAVWRDGFGDPLKLLHYRWLGEQYFLQRNQRNYSRVNEANRVVGHGIETSPEWDGKYSLGWYRNQLKEAREVV